MIDILKYKVIATRVLGRGGLILQKYSPEILMGVGIVGGVVATVMACKATLKIDEVVAKTDNDIARIEDAHECKETEVGGEYTEEDYKKDMLTVHVQRAINIGKLYLPAAGVGIGALACILGSHGIMAKRNVGLMAAYKLVEESYKGYRKRVAEQLGEEKERLIRHDIKEEIVTEESVNEKGKKVKTERKLYSKGGRPASEYAKWFNENSVEWQRNADYNVFFLKSQQNYMNDKLKARGHVILNEVYDSLGIPRTPAGALVGWVMDNERDGSDNYIDFGIFEPNNQDFINGFTKEILLDFNVDGVVYDLI